MRIQRKEFRFFLELDKMPDKGGRLLPYFDRHFSILIHENRLFLTNAVLSIVCLIIESSRGCGRDVDFWNLPVKSELDYGQRRLFLVISGISR